MTLSEGLNSLLNQLSSYENENESQGASSKKKLGEAKNGNSSNDITIKDPPN